MASMKEEEIKEKKEADMIYEMLMKLSVSEDGTKDKSKREAKPVNAASLKKALKGLQCHFNWKLFNVEEAKDASDLAAQMERKEREGEKTEDPWRDFYQAVLLAFCYAENRDFRAAHETLDLCVERANSQRRIRAGLMYVLDANRAFIHHLGGAHEESDEVLSQLANFEELSIPDQAAVHGLHAVSLMEQGVSGSKMAQKHVQKAIDLDPDQGEWHFLMGKILLRIRHLEDANSCPTVKECLHLEKAVELSSNPTHYLFLAQSLREKAKYFFYNFSREESASKGAAALNQRSLECYQTALRMNPECPRLNIRCADGFMKLPKLYRNNELAGRCLRKALELAPDNSMVNQKAGFYYERVEMDMKRAQLHYERAIECEVGGNFPAHLNLFNLKWSLDRDFDPFPVIADMMEIFTAKIQIVSVLIIRGLCQLTQNKDVREALQDFYKAVVESSTDFELNFLRIAHYTCFRGILNLEVLLEELEHFLEKEDQVHKTLLQENVIPVVKKIIQSMNRSFRGGYRGGPRGGRGGPSRGGRGGPSRGGPRGGRGRGGLQGYRGSTGSVESVRGLGGPRGNFRGGRGAEGGVYTGIYKDFDGGY